MCRTQPKHFWKYIPKFKKNDHTVTQIKSGDDSITKPQLIAGALPGHFQFAFNTSSLVHVTSIHEATPSGYINVPSFSVGDVTPAVPTS
jgi:hypothetical protein